MNEQDSLAGYLKSRGMSSDYAARANIAAKYGMPNYTGSAAQNAQLLTILRSGVHSESFWEKVSRIFSSAWRRS